MILKMLLQTVPEIRPTEKPVEVISVASVLREVFFYAYSWGEPSSFVTLTTSEPIVPVLNDN
jgi:hypothetical protein